MENLHKYFRFKKVGLFSVKTDELFQSQMMKDNSNNKNKKKSIYLSNRLTG